MSMKIKLKKRIVLNPYRILGEIRKKTNSGVILDICSFKWKFTNLYTIQIYLKDLTFQCICKLVYNIYQIKYLSRILLKY